MTLTKLARAQRNVLLNHAISPLLVLMAGVTCYLVLSQVASVSRSPVAHSLADIILHLGAALAVGLGIFVWKVTQPPVEAPSTPRAIPPSTEAPGRVAEIVERLVAPLPAARKAVDLPNALIGPAHTPALIIVLLAVFLPPIETKVLADLMVSAVAGAAVAIWGIVIATEVSRASRRQLDAAKSIAAGADDAGLRIPPPCERRANALGGYAYLRDYISLATTAMVLRGEQYVAMSASNGEKKCAQA